MKIMFSSLDWKRFKHLWSAATRRDVHLNSLLGQFSYFTVSTYSWYFTHIYVCMYVWREIRLPYHTSVAKPVFQTFVAIDMFYIMAIPRWIRESMLVIYDTRANTAENTFIRVTAKNINKNAEKIGQLCICSVFLKLRIDP